MKTVLFCSKTLLTVLIVMLSACGEAEVPVKNVSASLANNFELKVIKWAPHSMALGKIPDRNKAPDGSLGMWVEVSDTDGLGKTELLIAGQPAKSTFMKKNLITASISPEQLGLEGKNEILIRQVSTGKTFPVGVFIIESNKLK